MPDFSPLLLILLFVGARFLWRRMALEQARRQARNQPQARRPQTPPTPFQEAAPVRHQQVEPEKPSPYTSPVTMSGRGVMESADEDYTERWEEKKEAHRLALEARKEARPPTPAPSRPPRAILPAFNRQTVVQAVIAREILDRLARGGRRPMARAGTPGRPR